MHWLWSFRRNGRRERGPFGPLVRFRTCVRWRWGSSGFQHLRRRPAGWWRSVRRKLGTLTDEARGPTSWSPVALLRHLSWGHPLVGSFPVVMRS